MTDSADVLVFLRCPKCGHTWHAATIIPDLWWGNTFKPETAARQCYCVKCEQPPPMIVVGQEEQPRLF